MNGAAIIVNGEIVAWFANPDELSAEWCTAAYAGEWLAWPAEAPVLDGVSDEDMRRAQSDTAKIKQLFNDEPYQIDKVGNKIVWNGPGLYIAKKLRGPTTYYKKTNEMVPNSTTVTKGFSKKPDIYIEKESKLPWEKNT